MSLFFIRQVTGTTKTSEIKKPTSICWHKTVLQKKCLPLCLMVLRSSTCDARPCFSGNYFRKCSNAACSAVIPRPNLVSLQKNIITHSPLRQSSCYSCRRSSRGLSGKWSFFYHHLSFSADFARLAHTGWFVSVWEHLSARQIEQYWYELCVKVIKIMHWVERGRKGNSRFGLVCSSYL